MGKGPLLQEEFHDPGISVFASNVQGSVNAYFLIQEMHGVSPVSQVSPRVFLKCLQKKLIGGPIAD